MSIGEEDRDEACAYLFFYLVFPLRVGSEGRFCLVDLENRVYQSRYYLSKVPS